MSKLSDEQLKELATKTLAEINPAIRFMIGDSQMEFGFSRGYRAAEKSEAEIRQDERAKTRAVDLSGDVMNKVDEAAARKYATLPPMFGGPDHYDINWERIHLDGQAHGFDRGFMAAVELLREYPASCADTDHVTWLLEQWTKQNRGNEETQSINGP